MPSEVITQLEQVTVEWLTRVLTHSGALTHAVVTAFDVDTSRGNWSSNARLTVRYTAGAQGALPQCLFLKMVNPNLEDEFFGASEVTYYTRDYGGGEGPPLIRCYDAGYILKEFSPELKPHWPEMITAFYARHPQKMIERAQDPNGFTLIHGDAGHNNILVPPDGERPIYIIDRQPFDWSLTTGLGVYDLAYALVLDWDIDTRRQLEVPVLRRYHASLLQRGVNNYPWEQLVDDYRLCVAMGIYIATEYCRGGVIERLIPTWLPMLQRSLTACKDLKCGELW